MRTHQAIRTLGLLVISAAASLAATVTYNFNFVSEGGISIPLPTSGSFSYNTTTQTFNSIQITWDGYLFDFTAAANSATVKTAGSNCVTATTAVIYGFLSAAQTPACTPLPNTFSWIGSAVGPTPVFKIFDTSGASDIELDASNAASVTAGPQASGLFGAPSSSVPEPSTFFLALAGGGLLVGRRLAKAKR